MIHRDETKWQARIRNRKILEAYEVKIGCNKVESAKKKQGDQRQGKCLVCGEYAKNCRCDDRSEWVKERIG